MKRISFFFLKSAGELHIIILREETLVHELKIQDH